MFCVWNNKTCIDLFEYKDISLSCLLNKDAGRTLKKIKNNNKKFPTQLWIEAKTRIRKKNQNKLFSLENDNETIAAIVSNPVGW